MIPNLGHPKMRIVAYNNEAMRPNHKEGEFIALLNPESYTLNYEVEYGDNQAAGTSGGAKNLNRIKPKKLAFEFLFDQTGAIPSIGLPSKTGVEGDLILFRKTLLDWIGDKHKPPYLQLLWGKLDFKCYATKVSITYKLFRPDGTPIRAVAKAEFEEFIPAKLREAQEKNSSPDLTHRRTVKKGDTLPLMTYRIYGDSKYYLEVARVNQLNSFRQLQTGQEIYFPPLAK